MPSKPSSLLATLCITLYGILSFCGNLKPVALFASVQLLCIGVLVFGHRPALSRGLQPLWQHQRTNCLLVLAWLAMLAIAAIHSLIIHTNPNQHLAVGFRISYNLLQVGFFIVLLNACQQDKHFYNKAFSLFVTGFGLLAAIQITALASTQNPDAFQWLKFPLLNANIRESGMLAAANAIICSIYAITLSSKRQQALAFAMATFSFSYLFWTGGRMGIMASLLTTVVFALVIAYQRKKWLPAILLCFIGLPLALAIGEYFALFSWNGVARIFNHASSEHFQDPSSGRLEVWQYTLAAIKNHPIIGNGPFSFYFLEARKASGFIYDHPHNMPLQFLLEWGIAGTAIIAALLLRIYYQGWRIFLTEKSGNTAHTIALALVTMLTLHSLTSATYWSLQPVVILLLAYSCLVHSQSLTSCTSKPVLSK